MHGSRCQGLMMEEHLLDMEGGLERCGQPAYGV